MNNYWIVSQLFHPDETSTAHVITEISKTLIKNGCVNVICGTNNYQSEKLKSSEKLNEKIQIHRIKTPQLDKNNIIKRVLLFLIFSCLVIKKIILKTSKKDKLIIVTNPPTLLFLVALLKTIKRYNLTIIVQDVFPENSISAGIINKDSLFVMLVKKIMNYSYKCADNIITCGDDMSVLFENKGIDSEKIKTITNWADHNIIKPKLINRDEYLGKTFQNKILFEFAGNIGRVQGLEDFVKILSQSKNKNLELVIIGDGAHKNLIKKYINRNKINNIHLYDSMPRDEQINFINCCDIGLVTLKKGMYGLGVPSKVYNILSAGKPILYIGDENSEIDLYIKKNQIGWSFHWDEKENLLNFLNDFNSKDRLQDYDSICRDFILRSYTKDKILNKYSMIFR